MDQILDDASEDEDLRRLMFLFAARGSHLWLDWKLKAAVGSLFFAEEYVYSVKACKSGKLRPKIRGSRKCVKNLNCKGQKWNVQFYQKWYSVIRKWNSVEKA